MNYRIEKKDAFRIVGISAPLNREIENNFMIVPKMWEDAAVSGTIQKLAEMMDTPIKGLLGVSVCNDEEALRKTAGLTTTPCPRPPGQSFRAAARTSPYRNWSGAL